MKRQKLGHKIHYCQSTNWQSRKPKLLYRKKYKWSKPLIGNGATETIHGWLVLNKVKEKYIIGIGRVHNRHRG